MGSAPREYGSIISQTVAPPQQGGLGTVAVFFPQVGIGTVNSVISIASIATSQIGELVGYGEGGKCIAHMCSYANRRRILAVPLTATAGWVSAVTPSGAGPTITITGTPISNYRLKVQIVEGGALGTSLLRWSLDNGITWGNTVITAATIAVTDGGKATGLTLALAVGSYVKNDTYTAIGHAPSVATSTIAEGMAALKATGEAFDTIIVLTNYTASGDASDTPRITAFDSMLDACATAAGTAYNEGSPCSFIIPAPYAFTPTTKAGRDAWATALRLKILSNAANQWLMVAAGDDELQDAIGQGSKTLWDSPIIEVAGRACSYPVDKDFGAREDEDAWRGESSYNDFESDIIGDLTCCPVSAEQKTWFSAGWTMSGDETFKRFSNVRLSSQIYRLTKSELRKFANKNLTRVSALFKQSNDALVIGALTPSSATLIQNRVGTALRETNKLLDEPCQVFPDQSDTSKNIYVDIYFKGKEFVNNVFFRIGAY